MAKLMFLHTKIFGDQLKMLGTYSSSLLFLSSSSSLSSFFLLTQKVVQFLRTKFTCNISLKINRKSSKYRPPLNAKLKDMSSLIQLHKLILLQKYDSDIIPLIVDDDDDGDDDDDDDDVRMTMMM